MRRFARQPILASAVVAISSVVAFAQAAPSTPSSDGLELLTRVAKKYEDAKSYYVESVEERTSSSEYSHGWEKTILTAAEAPGNRHYYEGRSHTGSTVRVTDGTTAWTYRLNEHKYTAKPLVAEGNQSKIVTAAGFALFQAQNLRKNLGDLNKSLKSADWLPDATLKVNGHKVSCNVIHVRSSDQKRPSPNYSFDKTIWIDKNHETVLRSVEHSHTRLMVAGGAGIPMEGDIVTTFPNTDLDGPVRDSLFTFVPPPEARLIDEFPNPTNYFGGSNMTGDPVPSLKLKSADGKVVSLDSFRGKPVLIDFWATWCGPCVAALPKLDKIYQEARDKGLVLLSVDQDEEAKTAVEFFAKKGYSWPDFHDDGDIEKIMGSSGIPREVLIDAQGKIIYDRGGLDEDELRTEITKLGPEYASLRPKPKDAPCVVSN